ncbi:MAG: exodeoxyribonuclease III [Gammaproteobacteria bacterium]|nr:MAG: exodeoxyribonuclease III [Gammaproteobacteria bacterium]
MLRVISFNANGIRSAHRKGFFDWFATQEADLLCMQEVRAWRSQLDGTILNPPGYRSWFHEAGRKGYSGVAIYSRVEPDRVIEGLGWEAFDAEGRYLQLDFGNLSVASIYLPSGSSGEARQAAKFEFLERFTPRLRAMRASGREWILCGDFNIAHREIDLKNWRSNQKNSGFLPEERAWMDHLFGELGYVDAFRVVNREPDQYTWWSNRGRARENNVGWRIDYQVITPALEGRVRAASIHTQGRFSDHAPLTLDYDLTLRTGPERDAAVQAVSR